MCFAHSNSEILQASASPMHLIHPYILINYGISDINKDSDINKNSDINEDLDMNEDSNMNKDQNIKFNDQEKLEIVPNSLDHHIKMYAKQNSFVSIIVESESDGTTRKSCLVVQALMNDKTITSFEWVLSKLLESTRYQLHVLVTDSDIANEAIIENIIPETFRMNCIYYISQNLPKNLKNKLGSDWNRSQPSITYKNGSTILTSNSILDFTFIYPSSDISFNTSKILNTRWAYGITNGPCKKAIPTGLDASLTAMETLNNDDNQENIVPFDVSTIQNPMAKKKKGASRIKCIK
ncbi:46400_t:CDS:2, partial [Gigaspora margarita]